MNHFSFRLLSAASMLLLAAPLVAELPVAGDPPAIVAATPINMMRGNARLLLVFAPSSATLKLQDQAAILNRNYDQLADRNTVIVPIMNTAAGTLQTAFTGENMSAGNDTDQAATRARFGLSDDQFAVILLDQTGKEEARWSSPVTMGELNEQIRSEPRIAGR